MMRWAMAKVLGGRRPARRAVHIRGKTRTRPHDRSLCAPAELFLSRVEGAALGLISHGCRRCIVRVREGATRASRLCTDAPTYPLRCGRSRDECA
jgi:hypothetical protein